MIFEESLEVIKIYSCVGFLKDGQVFVIVRFFRSFYYIFFLIVIIGGGKVLKLGEVLFVYNGVLFLDEFFEFDKKIIEVFCQFFEDGYVIILRVNVFIEYFVRFMFVCVMNFCKCGYFLLDERECMCIFV